MKPEEALARTRRLPPRERVEILPGLTVRRTAEGIPITRIHYSAHPDRDPVTHPEWKKNERATYTSQAGWDREQEIKDEAGGGQLVFADVLVSYWNKIVITDPSWRPQPHWRVEGGFDHGLRNPTALERFYIDDIGTIYACGEYYMPNMEVWQHAPYIRQMADVRKIAVCYADPTIFDLTLQQGGTALTAPTSGHAQERAKSINILYVEAGIELFSPFQGDRSDVSFAARVMLHWSNLDKREPSFKIVCRNYSEAPQPGLHDWDCPNLLWEMMNRRRVQNTAQQLLTRNPSEALIDRSNHASDACKYNLLSYPEPTVKTKEQIAAEAVRPLAEVGDLHSAAIRYAQITQQESQGPVTIGRRHGVPVRRR